ncbi:PREDICTED: spindle and centriole-associated protein 1 [Propithecus coquereli]|uniref:spindle and centriole-associated protein 1 n=1 Tax=Propithecus coquereli TaxID=379532 RepID=UPI00063EF156|nr:PREDICTED: spindle and centriole-associated protein 1 [Propithecus coquereli]
MERRPAARSPTELWAPGYIWGGENGGGISLSVPWGSRRQYREVLTRESAASALCVLRVYMSFVRVHRYGPRGGGRKALKVKKKKTSVKQEWDIRRHEIHKSKNRALAHWELQEKALKRRWKKQKPETLNLEKRRLSIMKEILSDQYQMQDVLEKSDHLMAAAKDLFVDFPRRRTGFPNITMAPDSSQGPIVVNQDPITQAILNESVIEPQALNEVDDEGEEGTVNSQSGESENELDSSLNSEPNMNTDRCVYMA